MVIIVLSRFQLLTRMKGTSILEFLEMLGQLEALVRFARANLSTWVNLPLHLLQSSPDTAAHQAVQMDKHISLA